MPPTRRRRARYVLVYARESRNPSVGEAIAYSKDGRVAIFHKRSKIKVKPGDLVLCKIVAEQERFFILVPVAKIRDGKIPGDYEPVEVWGDHAYRKLRAQRRERRRP